MSSSPPTPPPDSGGRLDEVIAAYYRAVDAGERPDPQVWIDLNPDVAEGLKEFFANEGLLQPPTCPDPTPPAQVGDRIGPYKLLQKLGEGGMGTVYMAEQTEPIERKVALKVIKAGMDSARVIARFEQERQALAMMDHPNIAKVFDAGTMTARQGDKETGRQGEVPSPSVSLSPCLPVSLSAGRPYFVMELVKGIPITKYCDQEHLTPRERLELFIPVCQAVQHAHQKGIIHRDLKPTNVLIALYDGRPIPKVIDFGVAKATAQKLTERTLFTEVGALVGTLEYMAPEQAELNNLDIDTRADIYSLGVLLYVLLTGSPPFTAKQLRSKAFDEMLRMIREVEPPKPSTRLSSSEALPTIAANRKLEPKRLCKLVHGELDWIVMKCLEKERGRRYETANGLAMEVQRYLADEPVEAGPPSAAYRVRKFVRKHRVALVTANAFVLLLIAGVMISTWQAMRARTAEREVKADRDRLAQALDKLEKEKELSELAFRSIFLAFLEAGVQRAVALARQGEHRQAVRELEQYGLLEREGISHQPTNYAAASVYALAARSEADASERERYAARAVRLLARFKERFTEAEIERLRNDPEFEILRGRVDFQSLFGEPSRPGALRSPPTSVPTSTAVADELSDRARALLQQKKYDQVERILRECLAMRERASPNDWTRFDTQSLLGASLLGQKKYADAEPLLLQGYEGMKERAAKIPPQAKYLRLREAVERLVQLYDAWGRPDEAAKWRAKLPIGERLQEALERHYAWPLLWGWPRF